MPLLTLNMPTNIRNNEWLLLLTCIEGFDYCPVTSQEKKWKERREKSFLRYYIQILINPIESWHQMWNCFYLIFCPSVLRSLCVEHLEQMQCYVRRVSTDNLEANERYRVSQQCIGRLTVVRCVKLIPCIFMCIDP